MIQFQVMKKKGDSLSYLPSLIIKAALLINMPHNLLWLALNRNHAQIHQMLWIESLTTATGG